ncbi:multiheme C-type cytochrome [uncultured Desulfobulbus sp.]|uniref:multiheme C-type cytochrome n=1 Tax=uncultured Desulfobulbus sp. TaxID=239745 RepID=UPI0029C67C03|nr:multiheme C-type cytochrome [uncultured Desulfobulbus sp.]
MKRNALLLSRCLLTLLVLAGCCTLALAAEKKGKHPKLSEQEKYIACDQCHAENTPDLHKEWFDSRHGVAMVKCYQCHGTFETFRVTPKRQVCAVCHENMMKKCPQNKACWQCHLPHTFKAKK